MVINDIINIDIMCTQHIDLILFHPDSISPALSKAKAFTQIRFQIVKTTLYVVQLSAGCQTELGNNTS